MIAPELLSSRATRRYSPYRLLFVGIPVLFLVVTLMDRAKTAWSIEGFIVLAAFFLLFVLMGAYAAQFKQVSVSGPCLLVSDGKRDAHVPLGRILRVSQTARMGWWAFDSNPNVVHVVFRDRTPFGRSILFVAPTGTSFLSSQENPVVARLRRLCAENASESCPHEEMEPPRAPCGS